MWAYTHTLFQAWFSQGHGHAQNSIFDSILDTSVPQPNDKQDGGHSDLWLVHGLVLMLMLMSTHFSLAYVCACAHAYALVKTRLYCDLVKMRYTYWLWAACWASLHKPFRKPFGWCIWDTPPLFETGILVAFQVSWSWRISSLSRCLPLPDQPTGKLYGTIK